MFCGLFTTYDCSQYSCYGANLAALELPEIVSVLFARLWHHVVQNFELSLRKDEIERLPDTYHHHELEKQISAGHFLFIVTTIGFWKKFFLY